MGFGSLDQVLNLSASDLVTVVGGGGKTTLIYRLAQELKAKLPSGSRVVVSTTTKMWLPQPGQVDQMAWAPGWAQLLKLASQLRGEAPRGQPGGGQGVPPSWFIGRKALPSRKVQGLPRFWVDELRRQMGQDGGAILVEADGAAGKPVKVPDWYEPQVPSASTVILVVAGINSLGLPLASRYVHRAKLARCHLRSSLPDRITPAALADLVAYQAHRAQSMAPRARTMAVLNQVETPERLTWGREVAERLVAQGFPTLLTSFKGTRPLVWFLSPQVVSCRPRVAAIVLAAGTSSRMPGQNKLTLPLGGRTVLEQTVASACGSRAAEVVVVLGYQAAELKDNLRSYPVRLAFNPRFQEGQSTSVLAGLRAVSPGADAAVFLLGDQPLVTPEVIDALIDAYALHGNPVVAPTFRGQMGNPVLFGRGLFPELFEISGDRGGRPVLERHRQQLLEVPVRCRGILADIDDLPSYLALKSYSSWLCPPKSY